MMIIELGQTQSDLDEIQEQIENLKRRINNSQRKLQHTNYIQDEYLSPTKKWEKIKMALITKTPYELSHIAAYPFKPETKLTLLKGDSQWPFVTIYPNWRDSSETEPVFSCLDPSKIKGKNQETFLTGKEKKIKNIVSNASKQATKAKKNQWQDDRFTWGPTIQDQILESSKNSLTFEEKYKNFFFQSYDKRTRKELDNIFIFASKLEILTRNNESNSKARPHFLEYDFDKSIKTTERLKKEDFDQK